MMTTDLLQRQVARQVASEAGMQLNYKHRKLDGYLAFAVLCRGSWMLLLLPIGSEYTVTAAIHSIADLPAHALLLYTAAAARGDYNELEQLVAGQLAGLAPQNSTLLPESQWKHIQPA
jgi:hypothetical protein